MGLFFAVEVRSATRLDWRSAPDALLGAAVGFSARKAWLLLLGAPAASWPVASWTSAQLAQPEVWLAGLSLMLTLALVARGTLKTWHLLKHKAPRSIPIRALGLGAVLVGFELFFDPGGRLRGLGVETLQSFFHTPASALDVGGKIFATGLSLALGFKGGEFIPLALIGAATGSYLAHLWQLPLAPFAAAGFTALFGGLAQTPFSLILLALELFVPRNFSSNTIASTLAFGLLGWVTFLLVPARGIYEGQEGSTSSVKKRLAFRPWEYFARSEEHSRLP